MSQHNGQHRQAQAAQQPMHAPARPTAPQKPPYAGVNPAPAGQARPQYAAPHRTQPPHRPAMQVPQNAQVKPIATPPNSKKSKLFGPLSFGFGANSPGADRSQGAGNPFIWLTIAFLLGFLVISWSTVRKTERTESHVQSKLATSLNSKDADIISERIATQVNWMNTALAMRGNARQTVNVSARGPNVTAAAVLDSAGNVIASLPNQGTGFSNIPVQSLPKSGIAISYLLSEGGASNPLIILKSNDTYLVNQLTPGSLIGQNKLSGSVALIDRGGNPIDSSTAVAVNGVPGAFSLSEKVVTQLANSDETHNTVSKGNGVLTAISVPNTNLTLLSRGAAPRVSIPNNIVVFILLFFFTAALLSALLRAALSRFSIVRASHADSLIRQERYQVAVAGGRGGVWEIDLKNNNVYLNQSLAKLFGLADEDQELTIAQFLSLIHGDDRDRLLSVLRRTHLAGEMDIEVRVAHLPVVVHCRGQSSYRAVTNNTVIVGVAMDITEQRGAQARLQATEARLFDSLNSMTNSFVIWDALNRLVLWNGKFESFFGFQPGQLQLGMNKDIVEQQAQQNIAEFFEVEDDNEEIEIKLKNGRWIRYTEATTSNGSQVGIGNDITEIRSREQDLRENEIALRNTVSVLKKSQVRIMELADNYEQEKIRAEEASQSKSDFLANMSHELRTPLNAINGFSDIMKKEMFGPLGDPRYKEYVNDILFSGQHLLSLINDILDMSKIEAGKMTLHPDTLQINDIISQVVRIVRGRAEESRLKLIFDNSVMPEIEADHRLIKQVLLNLLTNAIKFTPEGGTVRVETIGKQAGIIVKVIDSGIGISQEDINRLAKPFEQIESNHAKQHEGTGLGLAITKSFIELHGGNFLMESVVGEGTTVTLTLPNRPIVQKEEATEEEVGNEINRLANDISEVLNASDGLLDGSEAA